jgi:hypothetical protein
VITDKTTLSELQAIAAMRGVKSIRLRPDIVDGSRFVAEVTRQGGGSVVRRGRSVSEAIQAAFDSVDTLGWGS